MKLKFYKTSSLFAGHGKSIILKAPFTFYCNQTELNRPKGALMSHESCESCQSSSLSSQGVYGCKFFNEMSKILRDEIKVFSSIS